MKRLILICSFFLQLFFITNAQWQPTNGPYGGNVNGLIIKDQNIFALAMEEGIFISTDNGTTWSPRNNGLTNLNVQCIALKGNRIFLGTSYGLFISDDNGTTWTTVMINGLAYFSVTALASNAQSVFMLAKNITSTGDTLYESDDGSSWVKNINDVSFNSLGVCGDTIFIGTNNEYLYRSTDNGVNFQIIDLTGYSYLSNPGSFTYSGSYLFAIAGTGGIFKSPDNGNTWTPATGGLVNEAAVTLTAKGNQLYAGMYEGLLSYNNYSNGGIYVSQNNGANWTTIGLTGITVEKIVFSGTRIIAGTAPKGICISDDDGVTWNPSNNGFVRLQVLAITNNGNDLFASCVTNTDPNSGYADQWGIMKSTDQGMTWVRSDSGISNQPITTFAVCNSIMLAGGYSLYLSSDHGLTWRLIFNPGYQITSLLFLDSLIFAGTGAGIFLSDNLGVTWHSVNNGLYDPDVSTLISKGNLIFAGTFNEVYRSSDNGTTWTEVSNGINCYYINAMASNNDFLFCAGISYTSQIFRSPDNGDDWISTNLGTDFTSSYSSFLCFAVSNENIIAGTYYQNSDIFFSGNNGETWSVLNTGLPNDFGISSLVIVDSTVYAGLNDYSGYYGYSGNNLGPGVWKRPLSEFIPFELPVDTVLLDNTASDSKSLVITSSTPWVLDGQLPTWVSVNKSSGTASDNITFTTTQANPNPWPRYAFMDIVSESISRQFTIIQKEAINGVGDQQMNAVSIFPNPTSGNIIINSPASYDKLTLTNTTGQILWEQALVSSKTQLDLSYFGKGVYYLCLSGEKESCIREIIVL
jgi:photosystem II stability/assembly factor-like uncharacterized protein